MNVELKLNLNSPWPLSFCPACQVEFGEALRPAIEELRTAIAKLAKRTPRVTLQITDDALLSQQ